MRRLDLHPKRTLRNAQRHLRGLAQWPDRIAEGLPTPEQQGSERFWNFKLPVFQKVVDPPHATGEAQRVCVAAMFAAAWAIEHSARRPEGCRVACLVTTPFLFESEVTLFFDEPYFRTFLPEASANAKRATYDGGWVEGGAADAGDVPAFVPPAPDGLSFHGGVWLRQFEDGWEKPVEKTTWVWAFARR